MSTSESSSESTKPPFAILKYRLNSIRNAIGNYRLQLHETPLTKEQANAQADSLNIEVQNLQSILRLFRQVHEVDVQFITVPVGGGDEDGENGNNGRDGGNTGDGTPSKSIGDSGRGSNESNGNNAAGTNKVSDDPTNANANHAVTERGFNSEGLDHLNGLELKCVEKCSAYIQNQQPYFSNKKQNGKQNESKLVGGEIEGDLGLNENKIHQLHSSNNPSISDFQ